jgi:TolB-like protein
LFIAIGASGVGAVIEAPPRELTVAVIDFEHADQKLEGAAMAVSDTLLVRLSKGRGIRLVDRNAVKRILGEQFLAVGGFVAERDAAKVGRLATAQIVVVGRISEQTGGLTGAARIIGVETTLMLPVLTRAGNPQQLATSLSDAVAERIATGAATLLPRGAEADSLEPLRAALAGRRLPGVEVEISEKGNAGPGAAATTRVQIELQQAGFKLTEPGWPGPVALRPVYVLRGAAWTEFISRFEDLYSCAGHLELRLIETQTGSVLLTTEVTARRVDATEKLAGQAALEEAARKAMAQMLRRFSELR